MWRWGGGGGEVGWQGSGIVGRGRWRGGMGGEYNRRRVGLVCDLVQCQEQSKLIYVRTYICMSCLLHMSYLFGAESVGGDNLHSEVACVHKPKRVQRYLPYHCVVRHHHSHSSKEHFQVVGEVRPTCIARVHGDANKTGGLEV